MTAHQRSRTWVCHPRSSLRLPIQYLILSNCKSVVCKLLLPEELFTYSWMIGQVAIQKWRWNVPWCPTTTTLTPHDQSLCCHSNVPSFLVKGMNQHESNQTSKDKWDREFGKNNLLGEGSTSFANLPNPPRESPQLLPNTCFFAYRAGPKKGPPLGGLWSFKTPNGVSIRLGVWNGRELEVERGKAEIEHALGPAIPPSQRDPRNPNTPSWRTNWLVVMYSSCWNATDSKCGLQWFPTLKRWAPPVRDLKLETATYCMEGSQVGGSPLQCW